MCVDESVECVCHGGYVAQFKLGSHVEARPVLLIRDVKVKFKGNIKSSMAFQIETPLDFLSVHVFFFWSLIDAKL